MGRRHRWSAVPRCRYRQAKASVVQHEHDLATRGAQQTNVVWGLPPAYAPSHHAFVRAVLRGESSCARVQQMSALQRRDVATPVRGSSGMALNTDG